ncbi:MAG: beta-N-acetylhexosaminidase [Gaiellaceae bacterium]
MSDAAACLFPGFDGETVPDWLKGLLAEGLGGVVLFGRNIRDPEQVAELTASLRAERPELIVATDEEGGDVTRLEVAGGSSFPGNFALGAVDDPALTRRVAAAIGGEVAAVGIDLDLAPVADVLVDPASAIVGVRSFGSDPQLVARQVAAFVEGLQSVGVAACAKHFPGHGETVADSHLELPSSDASLDVLRERALPPFAAAVDAGVRAVMTAHIRFGAFGEEPATWNSAVVELLRTELGFDGVVMTDALEMQGAGGPEGVEHSAVRALAAGADALCLGADLTPEQVEAAHAAIAAAVPEERLAEAARRVAELAAWTAPRALEDRETGAEAARRALRVEGDPAVGDDALVVELRAEPSIAAGESDHGLGELLGAETVRLHEGDALPPLDSGRSIVLVVRDAHRHPWQRELVVPGAVVVETGVPEWRPTAARAFVATNGPGRANLQAAAEVIRS